jgi:phage gp36-like protein
MKKKMVIMLLVLGMVFSFADAISPKEKEKEPEGIMAYCTIGDLREAYGSDRINTWARLDANTVERAIKNAEAEIDGYLISGGYEVPIAGPPEAIKKYCIDLSVANLVISRGVGAVDTDSGGRAVIEQAKVARHYLEKVAEGKFKIPGYIEGDKQTTKAPAGAIRVSAKPRLDWRGY